jgi:hypothetical protein
VIAREHENVDAIEARHAALLPMCEPRDDVFEPPEAAGRLGKLALTRGSSRSGLGISSRQIQTRRA